MAAFISNGTFVSPLKMAKLQFLSHNVQKQTELQHTFCGPFKSQYKHLFRNLKNCIFGQNIDKFVTFKYMHFTGGLYMSNGFSDNNNDLK